MMNIYLKCWANNIYINESLYQWKNKRNEQF